MESFKGHVTYFRIYDIGQGVNLHKAQEELKRKNLTEPFKLKKGLRAIVIDEAPIVVSLGSQNFEILGKSYIIAATAKLWNFGAISIVFKIRISPAMAYGDFKNFTYVLENDEKLERMALDSVYQIVRDLGGAISEAKVWTQFEDYLIFSLDPDMLGHKPVISLLDSPELYHLVLTEPSVELSQSVKDSIRANAIQYTVNDLSVVDWNSAFLCSYHPDDIQDICDVIEFGLCQSLELRYYDDKLDRKLSAFTKMVQTNKSRVFSSPFTKLAEEAALFFIEVSDIKEKINNSLKVVGDIHYAKIYRIAIDRLRLKEWNDSLEEKLENLKEVALVFQNDINEKRNILLEITIILLITIEVIPFLWGIFQKLFN